VLHRGEGRLSEPFPGVLHKACRRRMRSRRRAGQCDDMLCANRHLSCAERRVRERHGSRMSRRGPAQGMQLRAGEGRLLAGCTAPRRVRSAARIRRLHAGRSVARTLRATAASRPLPGRPVPGLQRARPMLVPAGRNDATADDHHVSVRHSQSMLGRLARRNEGLPVQSGHDAAASVPVPQCSCRWRVLQGG
jgi:hypothetical protein